VLVLVGCGASAGSCWGPAAAPHPSRPADPVPGAARRVAPRDQFGQLDPARERSSVPSRKRIPADTPNQPPGPSPKQRKPVGRAITGCEVAVVLGSGVHPPGHHVDPLQHRPGAPHLDDPLVARLAARWEGAMPIDEGEAARGGGDGASSIQGPGCALGASGAGDSDPAARDSPWGRPDAASVGATSVVLREGRVMRPAGSIPMAGSSPVRRPRPHRTRAGRPRRRGRVRSIPSQSASAPLRSGRTTRRCSPPRPGEARPRRPAGRPARPPLGVGTLHHALPRNSRAPGRGCRTARNRSAATRRVKAPPRADLDHANGPRGYWEARWPCHNSLTFPGPGGAAWTSR
jgi:hypothetical protein